MSAEQVSSQTSRTSAGLEIVDLLQENAHAHKMR